MSSDLATFEDLAALTLALVDIPSVSQDEGRLESAVRSAMPSTLHLHHDADSVLLYLPERRPGAALVLFAGHTDTVPIDGNVPGRRSDDTIHGRGTSDMKGGLAVMVTLANDLAAASKRADDLDVGFLFFGREELPASFNPLPSALESIPRLRAVDFAVLMEPTANALEAGCQGNLNLQLTFTGRASHSARPWLGENAAHAAILALEDVAAGHPEDVTVDGLLFREVASITGLRSGVARNVIPAEATVDINVRYSPDRSAYDIEQEWQAHGARLGAEVLVMGNARPAPVVVTHPLAQRLLACGAGAPVAKQAWTNAADFAAVDVPAVNFGPGDPSFAHTANEQITVGALYECLCILRRFVGITP